MFNEKLLELLKTLAKDLKCDYITVSQNRIYGTDGSFAHLSYIEHTEPDLWNLENIVFYYNDMLPVNKFHKDKMNSLIINLSKFILVEPSIIDTHLGENENLREILNKKASEGLTLFKYGKYIFSINKTLLPLNKNDKLILTIRDINRSMFLNEFCILKGKKKIYKYYMYMSL